MKPLQYALLVAGVIFFGATILWLTQNVKNIGIDFSSDSTFSLDANSPDSLRADYEAFTRLVQRKIDDFNRNPNKSDRVAVMTELKQLLCQSETPVELYNEGSGKPNSATLDLLSDDQFLEKRLAIRASKIEGTSNSWFCLKSIAFHLIDNQNPKID